MKPKQFLHSDKTFWSYLQCYIEKFPIGKPSCLSSHYLLTDNMERNIYNKARLDFLQKPFFVKDIRKNKKKLSFDSGKWCGPLGNLRMTTMHKCINNHIFDVLAYFLEIGSKCGSWLMKTDKSLYSHKEEISIINDCYLQNFLLFKANDNIIFQDRISSLLLIAYHFINYIKKTDWITHFWSC